MNTLLISGRTFGLILLIIMFILFLFFMYRASGGNIEKVRKLPPLEAMEDAVGRAIETGRPVLVTYSFTDDFNAPVMVGLEAVRYVSQLVSEKGGKTLVAVGGARTLPVAIENYRLGCIEGGAPELFDEKNVYFFTNQQWAYASGVIGLMQRERPASCVFIGPFLVEGIHLGIASRRINTIAIGGNNSYSMAAFMFVTMDYVLLGEEMFAAGAYMSQDPVVISGIACEDLVKWFLGIILVIGALTMSLGSDIVIRILGV
jgi:hypothetical protein